MTDSPPALPQEHFPGAAKAIWDFEGIFCSSRHIPGVRYAGLIHPGLIGTAPSHELLKIWNDREKALCDNAPPTLVRKATPCA